MSISSIRVIMGRIAMAESDSMIAVFKHNFDPSLYLEERQQLRMLNSVFADTTETMRIINDQDIDYIGSFSRYHDKHQVISKLNKAVREQKTNAE